MVGRTGWPDVAEHCQLWGDRPNAAALASLGRLPREKGLDHNHLWYGLAPFTGP
jgi:hypothetical protein